MCGTRCRNTSVRNPAAASASCLCSTSSLGSSEELSGSRRVDNSVHVLGLLDPPECPATSLVPYENCNNPHEKNTDNHTD